MPDKLDHVAAALLAEWKDGNSAVPFRDNDPATDYFATEIYNFARAALKAAEEYDAQ